MPVYLKGETLSTSNDVGKKGGNLEGKLKKKKKVVHTKSKSWQAICSRMLAHLLNVSTWIIFLSIFFFFFFFLQASDSTLFLVAGYSRYCCPYVWVRSNHHRLMKITGAGDDEKDNPLRLKSTMKWKDGGEICFLFFYCIYFSLLFPYFFNNCLLCLWRQEKRISWRCMDYKKCPPPPPPKSTKSTSITTSA